MQFVKLPSMVFVAFFLVIFVINSSFQELLNPKMNVENELDQISDIAQTVKMPKNDLEALRLKGKVKTVKQYIPLQEADQKDGKIYKKSYGNKLWVFNKAGNKIESYQMNPSGEFFDTCYIEFDKKGDKTQMMCYSKGKVKMESNWEYNKDGQLLMEKKKVAYINDKTVYEYNQQGQLISLKEHNRKGEVKRTRVYEHNEKGNVDQEFIYDKDGKQIGRNIFDYDANNHIILEKRYAQYRNQYKSNPITGEKVKLEGERVIHKSSYTYNEQGQMLTAAYYDNDTLLSSKVVNVYDKNGNKIEKREYNGEGKGTQLFLATYNDAGHLLDESWYDIDPAKWTEETVARKRKEYEVDEQGNWLKVRRFDYGVRDDDMVREITYY